MKTPVTSEYYQKLLNAIKATQFLMTFHMENGEFNKLKNLALDMHQLTDELTSVFISEEY